MNGYRHSPPVRKCHFECAPNVKQTFKFSIHYLLTALKNIDVELLIHLTSQVSTLLFSRAESHSVYGSQPVPSRQRLFPQAKCRYISYASTSLRTRKPRATRVLCSEWNNKTRHTSKNSVWLGSTPNLEGKRCRVTLAAFFRILKEPYCRTPTRVQPERVVASRRVD